jgi:hypothetical protein
MWQEYYFSSTLISVHTCINRHTHTHTHTHIHMYIHTHPSIHTSTTPYVHACISTHTHTHTSYKWVLITQVLQTPHSTQHSTCLTYIHSSTLGEHIAFILINPFCPQLCTSATRLQSGQLRNCGSVSDRCRGVSVLKNIQTDSMPNTALHAVVTGQPFSCCEVAGA